MTQTTTRTITIANIAGGDSRRFRGVSDAAIRHARRIARRTYGGWVCDDSDAADEIQQAIDDLDDQADWA